MNESTIKRAICYNTILIIFCVLKYILYINIFSGYPLAFEAVTTLIMAYVYIKIFSWGKIKFNYVYVIYIIFIISIWMMISVKYEAVNNILLYNLKNFSTCIFIIMEPVMVVHRE